MILFMTSSPGGHTFEEVFRPVPFDGSNDFLVNLKSVWKDNSRCLFVACMPEDIALNDKMTAIFRETFPLSGLSISCFDICDSRSKEITGETLANYDFILLSGGHLPTGNAFYEKIKLREALKNYGGIVMGISAGTMNCAEEVYILPELEGEAVNPDFVKFGRGLGYTDIQVIPHYQYIKDNIVDGKRLIDDIAANDSMGRTFYLLPDGSYIIIRDGNTVFYGEAYTLSDGRITRVN